jgi:hypothetical protein
MGLRVSGFLGFETGGCNLFLLPQVHCGASLSMKRLLFLVGSLGFGVLADDFINLTFDEPDLTGSLTPMFPTLPDGPFHGETTRLLRGWTATVNGVPIERISYTTPRGAVGSEEGLNFRSANPTPNGPGYYLFVYSARNPLGPEFRLSQTGMIPADASRLDVDVHSEAVQFFINGQSRSAYSDFLYRGIDVSDWAGQVATLEVVFPRGYGGYFDIAGFSRVPEPSTWALMGVGGLALGWALRRPVR